MNELQKLKHMVKTGDNVIEGSEIDKLRKRHLDEGVSIFNVSLSPSFNGTAEDIARDLNKTSNFLSDPINRLVSRIQGHIAMKRDTVMCMTNRHTVTKNGFVPSPLNKDEEYRVKTLQKEIDLFQEAIDLIQQLRYK